MLSSPRVSGLPFRLIAFLAALTTVVTLRAQTPPQLLPYIARQVAGLGTTAAAKGSVCAPAANTAYTSYDAFGDGCLANQVALATPRSIVMDPTGAIYYTDYNTTPVGVVHRIDPVTGVVTAVAGGGAANPAAGAACSTVNSADSRTLVSSADVFGDGCLATSVKLARPTALALAPNGDLFIVDVYNYDIRRVSTTNGGVSAVALTNGGGSGYTAAPTVTFSAPNSGTTATGTATINAAGSVTAVTITNAGTGYTSAPTVTFSAPTGTNPVTATGSAAFSGVIYMADGNLNGTTTSTTGRGYAENCSPTVGAATPCILDAPNGVAVDRNGVAYFSEEYYDAILAYSPTATTVLGITVPAGIVTRVAGARTGTPPTACTNGTASTSGCSYGNFTNNTPATQDFLDNNYNIALDTFGNLYIADYYLSAVPQISAGVGVPQQVNPPAAGILNNYAGLYPPSSTATTQTQTARGRSTLGTFGMGKDYGVATDNLSNLYITDTSNSLIWRVDAAGQYQYTIAGGGAATVANGPCGTTAPASSLNAVDTFGDGCPGANTSFATPWGVYADPNFNVYVADGTHLLYREIATGAQFGNTGAKQTDYLEVHFAAGDGPATTAPYTITAGATIFTVGAATCKTNADTTQDCVLPVTAAPPAPGAYSGTLTVRSIGTPGGVNYALSGFFAQSPITRTTVTAASAASTAAGCSGTTYPTTSPVTLTANIIYSGPVAPTGNIVFANNGVTIGTVPVSNLNPSGTPVYGAVLSPTFSTAGTENVTATYVYTPPTSGQVYTYVGSASPATTFTIAVPTFSIAPVSGSLSTIKAGGAALYSFTVSNTLYTGTISFACSNLPAGATCVFSPTTVTGAGCSISNTVALNINTTAPNVSYPAAFASGRGAWALIGLFAAAVLAAMLGIFRRRIPLRATQLLLALAFLLGASGLVACSKSAGTVISAGTPTGTYSNITVTATGTDGTIASTTITLTVN